METIINLGDAVGILVYDPDGDSPYEVFFVPADELTDAETIDAPEE